LTAAPTRTGASGDTSARHGRRVRRARPDLRSRPSGGGGLRWRLVVGDAVAVAAAWSVPWLVLRDGIPPWFVPAQVAVAIFFCARQRLYLARVCAVRAVEMARLGRVATRSGVTGAFVLWQTDVHAPLRATLIGVTFTFAALALSRGGYRSLLMRARRDGRHLRAVIIVGTDDTAAQLAEHIGRNPAFGYRVVGVVGDRNEHSARGFAAPYLGAVTNTAELALQAGANGTIVSSGAAPIMELNRLMRDLLDGGFHVQMTSGLRGFAHERMISHDIAYEPLLYLEPVQLSRTQQIVKRGLDLLMAPLVLLATAPVFVAIGIAIKVTSRGPVFYAQHRVGYEGRTFTMYKFRTMVVGADALGDELAGLNLRDGPLFKLEHDPRVTTVGRLLRATSLDELPQLLNVVTGSMTLVGPRPALEQEVAAFDDELLRRFSVRPGVTGLWQLEARDDPDFDAYRRLDLFYVENWSLSLDLAIMIGTVADVVVRGVGSLTDRHSGN